MFERELFIFAILFLLIRFLSRNYRTFYLAWQIPNSEFDMSLKGIRTFIKGDGVTAFKFATAGNYGPLTKTWLGPLLFVLACQPEDVKIVMNAKECLDKPWFVQRCIGLMKGSVFGGIHEWHTHRKVLSPYFGINFIRTFIPIMNEKTDNLLNSLRKVDGKGQFDSFYYTASLTLESVLRFMELDVDVQNMNKPDRYTKHLKQLFDMIGIRLLKFWLYPNFIYRFTSNYKKEMEARSNCGMSLTPKIIENIRNSMKIDDCINNNNNNNQKSFVRAMLDPKHNFSEEEIFDEVRTLIVAAHETTAITLSSTLLLLAMHKDVQDKVHDELVSVFGGPSDDLYIELDQVNKLEYLELVINETMRLLPIVPIVLRVNDEEITSSEGHIIPAKSTLFVPIFNIHRNKKFWGDDAEEFKPHRFSKDEISKINPYAYLPFTKGQRMCTGWRYAMILMKIQLAKILLNYKMDTKLKLNELEFQYNITMSIVQGYQISIEKRIY